MVAPYGIVRKRRTGAQVPKTPPLCPHTRVLGWPRLSYEAFCDEYDNYVKRNIAGQAIFLV